MRKFVLCMFVVLTAMMVSCKKDSASVTGTPRLTGCWEIITTISSYDYDYDYVSYFWGTELEVQDMIEELRLEFESSGDLKDAYIYYNYAPVDANQNECMELNRYV